MADEPSKTSETLTPANGETQAATTPNTNQETPTAAELQAQLESANKRIKELNSESAKHRKLAEAAIKAEEDRKAAEMSETDKLKADLDKAKQAQADVLAKANERILRAEVIAKAAALNFADPADALALLDKSKVKVNDEGEVEGADEALKELAKAKPYMLKRAVSGSATNPGEARQGETSEQRRARLYGSGGDIFSPSEASKHGGGVVFPGQH